MRRWRGLLLATFVVLPFVELYLLIQVGQVIGAWWTILIVILDGMLGAYLMKREGRRAWTALQEALQHNRVPGKELADAALVLIGGVLLLTPGFISDVAGLLCVLPLTRPVARGLLTTIVMRRLRVHAAGWGAPGQAPGQRTGDRRDPGGADPHVVRGDVVE